MGRRRAMVLIAVHVLFAIHITHWLNSESGRTISPVEPSESMYFLEKGEFNAGVVFFATALLLTAIFGRFFCGWGCHVVALQDWCGAIMKRCGVRPRLFRSRLLMFVPLIIGLEMFIFPVVKQRILGKVIDDIDWRLWFDGMHPLPDTVIPWTFKNELITESFWDTFAGPWMAIPFLFVCGFAVVYFLGAKGFCTYGCPYGAFFAGMDRIAPGKIVANLDTCQKCGECSAHCTSNVRVHQEIQDWGKVVSAGCMKCLDCVSVCPTGSLKFGFTTPLLFSRPLSAGDPSHAPRKKRYDLRWGEEIALFILFFWIRYSWRGVYHAIPMLMATGIAGCLTFLVWKALRLRRDRDVSFHRTALKRAGELTTAGRATVALAIGSILLTGLLFASKWSQEQAEWQYKRLEFRRASLDQAFAIDAPPFPDEVIAIAARGARNQARLRTIGDGGISLFPQPEEIPTEQRLGYMRAIAGDLEEAKVMWERALADSAGADPGDPQAERRRVDLEERYAQLVDRIGYDAYIAGGATATIPIITDGLEHLPTSPFLANRLSLLHREAGNLEESARWRQRADELQREAIRRAQEAAARRAAEGAGGSDPGGSDADGGE